MKRPVIELTSWNRQATNGRAMLADSSTPQATPMAALKTLSLVASSTSNPALSDRISTVKKNKAKKFIIQQKSR